MQNVVKARKIMTLVSSTGLSVVKMLKLERVAVGICNKFWNKSVLAAQWMLLMRV